MPASVNETLKRRSCGTAHRAKPDEVERLILDAEAAALGVVIRQVALLQEVIVLQVVVERVGAAERFGRVRQFAEALR